VTGTLRPLGPFVQEALARAERFAWRIHAEEVTVEHLFHEILADEESGAAQVALFAFADPETLAAELLAICPGISVVGSGRCLPFSARGVRALRAARALAARGAAPLVEPAHLLGPAWDELEPAARASLATAQGRRGPDPAPAASAPRSASAGLDDSGPLFRAFSNSAKRALSAAANQAARSGRPAIAPAHLWIGILEIEPELQVRGGLSAARARQAIGPLDADPSEPEARRLPLSAGLRDFLGVLAPGADSVELLAHLLATGEPQMRQIFLRQKVTAEVLERSRGRILDPGGAPG
jgi:hypothetical protein